MASKTVEASLLCLKCRKVGHVVGNCSVEPWRPDVHWSSALYDRDSVRSSGLLYNVPSQAESLCARCKSLNVPGLLMGKIEWKSITELDQMAMKGRDPSIVLGQVSSIEYSANCQLCCALFALTPDPYSEEQSVVILPTWTILRLEGSIQMSTALKQDFAKCLVVTLRPNHNSFAPLPFSDTVTRGDALALAGTQEPSQPLILGGRLVKTDGVDTDLIRTWIDACEKCHPLTCRPQTAEQPQSIRLIDCSDATRPILVPYPSGFCEYITLSYVWGPIEKQWFKLGPIPSQMLPRTIADAITLTRKLGKKYLWCDYVCIDQLDEETKMAQISKMADIYRSAYATIVAISAGSADVGLPQLSSEKSRESQISCHIDGVHLVNLMPALTEMLWTCPWGQRSWTLQEALLSRRCIYLSDSQMHFECNGMQCCETLDESQSPVHQSVRTEDPLHSDIANIGTGCLRFNRAAFNLGQEGFLRPYASQVVLYSYRSMTDSADAINAFSGLLQEWKEDYGFGFHFGLPTKYFQWGLLWSTRNTLQRRPGFPSWSWAGWKGPLRQNLPLVLTVTDPMQTYLSVFTMSEDSLDLLFTSRGPTWVATADNGSSIDPITLAGAANVSLALTTTWHSLGSSKQHSIVVDGIVLELVPNDWPINDTGGFFPRAPDDILSDTTGPERRRLFVTTLGSDVAMQAQMAKRCQCVLVTREKLLGWVHHWLIVLDLDDDIARRVTTMRLSVGETDLDILADFVPTRKRLVMV